ncbi:MAG: hypothetical protein U1F49_14490 [Rubrivivax sp.]
MTAQRQRIEREAAERLARDDDEQCLCRPLTHRRARPARPALRWRRAQAQKLVDVAGLQEAVARFVREREWEPFHSPKNLAMALTGEVGELVELFQWLTEGASRDVARNPATARRARRAGRRADLLPCAWPRCSASTSTKPCAASSLSTSAAIPWPRRGNSRKAPREG